MKKSFMVLLCVMMCMFAFSAGICAADVTSGTSGDTNWSYDTATKTLTFALQDGKTSGSIATYNQKTFAPWCESDYVAEIEKAVIGEGITQIGSYAFSGCTGLKEVILSSELKGIGGYAFAGCTSLTDIELPTSLRSIANYAFLSCTTLKEITIPVNAGSNLSYSYNLFEDCTALEKVIFPANMATIPQGMFSGCTSLKTIVWSDNLSTIGNKAFMGCTSLETFDIPATVKTLGISAFSGCIGLTTLEVPATITNLQNNIFDGCTGLKEVVIDKTGDEMFANCTSLQKVTFRDDATTFGTRTFKGCVALKTVVVPESLTAFGNGAFSGISLDNVSFEGAGSDNFTKIGQTIVSKDGTTLYYVNPSVEGVYTVSETVRTLGIGCFSGCEKLTDVKLNENITEIPASVFQNCISLKTFDIPATVQLIGESAFSGCTALCDVNFAEKGNLTKISARAFYGCASLKELNLPDGLTYFGNYAICGTGIKKLVIPEGVTYLGMFGTGGLVVERNDVLEEIELPSSLTSLIRNQFYNCSMLKELLIPDSVTKIEAGALMQCPSLEKVVLPESLASVTSGCFDSRIPVIYYPGTREKWESVANYNKVSVPVICNYKAPATTEGALEVKSYPETLIVDDVEDLKTETLSLVLAYPEGTEASDDDIIAVDWYYSMQRPDGISGVKGLSSSEYSFDRSKMVASVELTQQYENAKNGTAGSCYYVCVAFKTDAEGITTMMIAQPIVVVLRDTSLGMEGKGTKDAPYLIKTYENLTVLAEKVANGNNFSDVYFEMANDITLKADWAQLGTSKTPFSGIINGADYTLLHEKGAKSLLGYARNATISNLNIKGEFIASAGLLSNYVIDTTYVTTLTVDHCKILSGTSILGSGFVDGNGSGLNGLYFSDCEVEKNVKIGWNSEENKSAERDDIGSYIGGLNGVLTNCKSAAEVYGNNHVGGLVGAKNQAMGACMIQNCSFTGKIMATGNYVGGILGMGYSSNTAPNAVCASIQNCYVNADISGKDNVGGIYGGEDGVDQAWDNGAGYIRNNLFYGSLKSEGTKGGIIGFMRSLDRYNVIENNFFYDVKGCTNGIGAVEHIDTSAKSEMGMENGVFYYDTSRDSLADIKEVVDAEDKGTADWQYTSVYYKNHNRTDNPLGADKDKLAKACTSTEMSDGTVLKQLNGNASSMKNWIQPEGAAFPVISDEPIVTELLLAGEYKTEYYIGEELDMTGAVFTATWSDGKTTDVSLDDIIITGFDSSARKTLLLTAGYKNASVQFTVKIVKNTAVTFEVSFTLLGDSKHGDLEEGNDGHTLAHENLTTWLEKKTYTVAENATVWDLLQVVAKENGNVTFHTKAGNSNYISYVTFNGETLGEFDNGTNSGWMYILNGRHPLLGVQEQFLEPGDEIVWHYTDNYTIEDPADDARVAVMETIKLIDAIGEVNKDSKAAIDAARAAYDALDKDSKAKVTNYEVLIAAEDAYNALPKDEPNDEVEIIDSSLLPFKDLDENWYKQAVAYVYSYELMNGMSATTFEPQTTLTRAMVATILYRMEGEPAVNGNNAFSDVKNDVDGAWYYNAVLWATQNGIVEGYEDGTFRPVREITREEMAAMMYRYAEYKGLDVSATANFNKFSDGAKVSAWAKPYMSWAVGVNLITGHDNGTLEPQGTATRAQAATVLMRFNEMVK